MYKGKLLALVGMAILGVAVFAVTSFSPSFAQPASTSDCVAARYGDNGTTLTPYGPNACHKKRVFYNYGTYSDGTTRYQTGNLGNTTWSNWLVHCPSGSTVQSHSSVHYSFSPNISGTYDGPGHSFCVDSNGNEVEPIPARSVTEPRHSHTKVALAKVKVVDTGAEYFMIFNPMAAGLSSSDKWVSCPGGVDGPYPQVGSSQDSTYDFPNHYHCKNPSYNLSSSNEADHNAEANPVVAANIPVVSLVAYGFSTASSTATNQFADKSGFASAPMGTIMCVSSTSDKMYASTTGTCPAASEFPVAPTYSFTWAQASAPASTINIATGSEAILKANLRNTGNISATYTFTCNVSPYRPVSYRMLAADNTTVINLTSGQLTVGIGVVNPSQVYCVVDMSSGTAGTTYNITFDAYTASNPSDTKSLQGLFTATQATPVSNSCTALSLTTDAASYVRGTNVNYTYSCATPAAGATISTAIVQVIKPDGTVTTYVTGSNVSSAVTSTGFETDNLVPGAYTLRVCMTEACPAATTVSRAFAITAPTTTTVPPSTTTCGTGMIWCPATSANTTGYCAAICAAPTTACGTGYIWCPATSANTTGYCAATCTTTTNTTVTPPPPPPPVPPGTQVTSCVPGNTCPSTSYCDNGQKCNYPDGQITCIPYPTPTATATATATTTAMEPPACPSGTSPCGPGETLCRYKTMPEVEYVEGMWCWSGQKYFRTVNGKEMVKCFGWSETPPTEYSNCRASDTSCVRIGGYGSKNGTCNSMRCYQTAEDSDYNNDMYCVPPSTNMMDATLCPSGYSQCSAEDKARGCRQVGDTWTVAEEEAIRSNTPGIYSGSFYCMSGQQCNLASGGGQCVQWNQTCPAGTKYCSANDTGCVEPDSFKTITPRTDGTSYSGFWCGGGSGMPFYSTTQVYCSPKKSTAVGATPITMMWTAADVKTVLDRLGAGWGLCNPNDNNSIYGKCREPGQTAKGSDWCAWMPPMMGGGYSGYGNETRICPKLTDPVVVQPKEDEKEKEKEKPKLCLQVLTSAVNPLTGECKTYNDSCIPEGWRPSPGGCSDQNKRQRKFCAEDEIPTSTNACEFKSYRMDIDTCKVESCENGGSAGSFGYIEVKGNKDAKYSSCTPMAVGFERAWREARCAARPPREFGSAYWFNFDSTAPTVKYNPSLDGLVACDTRENVFYAVAQPLKDETFYSCEYVPKKDQAWYLEKMRADRKMFLLYREQGGNDLLITDPIWPPVITIPEISKDQCPNYIAGLRSGVAADKQFWKDMQRKASQMAGDYYGEDDVNNLLKTAKELIVKIERGLRDGSCDANDIADVLVSQNQLHSEIFMQLNSFIPEIEDYAQYSYCSQGLASQADQLDKLLDSANLSKIDGRIAGEWMMKIRAAKEELDLAHKKGDFEVIYRCNNFGAEAYKAIAPLFRKYDVELNRIIDEVIGDRLLSVIDKLEVQLAQREKKVDELLVQVAELHKKVEALSNEVTEAANRLTERLTVSYSALARIEDKFAEQKLQIETAKDRLTSAVERAIQTMETAKCVTSVNRDTLIEEFGTVASVNWIDESEVDQIERRIDLFVASCTAKDVQNEDIYLFTDHIREASETNLEYSYEQGLTPFPDVPTHTWFYGGMSECYRRGCMTQGRPNDSALRQDALLMLLRESGASDADINGSCALSSDIQASGYAKCAINYARSKGLALSGNMMAPVAREEIALWIDNLRLVPDSVPTASDALANYVDVGDVAPKYLPSIQFVVTNGAMVGQVGPETSTFQPHDPLTRAALSVVLEHVREE